MSKAEESKEYILEDLAGREYMLSGVDFMNEDVASCIRFILDGCVCIATEDPEDGYRSSMKNIAIYDYPSMVTEIKNRFEPVRVVAKHDGESADILFLTDKITGKLVLEVGTQNIDDYYPYFVSEFRPENMATNNALTFEEPIPDIFPEPELVIEVKRPTGWASW